MMFSPRPMRYKSVRKRKLPLFLFALSLAGVAWWVNNNWGLIAKFQKELFAYGFKQLPTIIPTAEAEELPNVLPAPVAQEPAAIRKQGNGAWHISRETDRIRGGESLFAALARHQISNQESFQLAEALRKELNLRTIQPGDVFVLERQVEPAALAGPNALAVISSLYAFELVRSDGFGVPARYRAVRGKAEVVTRNESAFSVTRIHTPVTKVTRAISGKVSSSLYEGILYAGGDPALVNRFSDVFAWQLDFYREVQKGDGFKMIVETRFADGRFIGYGRVLAAEYNNAGRQYRGFYFESDDGKFTGIFDEQGNSLEKSFLRSPMELARITSRYGQRFHPILRQQKRHNGVDYGAPTGTPFWSIADGVVLEARYSLTAGKMIRIRHRNGFMTEYFHASRIAPGVKVGAAIRQRQVIGYVGTTGRSTGPHLHFGMTLNKNYVDPSKQNFPAGRPVPSKLVKAYMSKVKPLVEKLEKIVVS
jgi:murein DD-endopeptidase MepM/ murein hydrolase activator NlpD